MNPLTNVRNLQKINERELELGLVGKKSWHDKYKNSAWIFVGGLSYDLTEGDIICVFSQYGEIVNINLVRDKKTGKIKGYGFLCYEDQRSSVLAVDNFNGAKILGRTMRVDHVENYKQPKEFGDEDEVTKELRSEGCAPQHSEESEQEEEYVLPIKKVKKEKKSKKKKKEKKKKHKKSDSSSDSGDEKPMQVKKEKHDSNKSENYGVHKERGDNSSSYSRDVNGQRSSKMNDRNFDNEYNDRRMRDSDRQPSNHGRSYERDRQSNRGYQSQFRGDNSRGYRRDRSRSPHEESYKRYRDQSSSPPRRRERSRDK